MQNGPNSTIDGIFSWFITFLNEVLVPLIFALAFLLFLFGVFKYFFSSGAKAEDNRKEGRKFVMWGVIAFAIMISLWGIVNVLVRTFNFDNQARPCLPTFGNPNCENGSRSGGSGPTNLLPDGFVDEPRDTQSNLPGVY